MTANPRSRDKKVTSVVGAVHELKLSPVLPQGLWITLLAGRLDIQSSPGISATSVPLLSCSCSVLYVPCYVPSALSHVLSHSNYT